MLIVKYKLIPPKRIRRKINLKSKKIVYVGHSYHAKTKSTRFLIDYLKEHFEVTEVLDDSWRGKPFPDLSFIDESYLAVVFFQSLPKQKIVSSIKNQNIIFFPMYDNVGNVPFEYWRQYQHVKFINFSNTLHKKLLLLGLDSTYIQYFPKPLPFTESKDHCAFFWQRVNKIDINLVEKLLGDFKTKIHIHRSIDPEHTFVAPTKTQEKKFEITYSDWFKTREAMQRKIQECDIYIAPREYEGIGLSFLEAMAMGKAVIAVDSPTMNEYITDQYNGFLFKINDPKPVCIRNIGQIKKNAYLYIKSGYKKWENNKRFIINYIKRE